MDEVTRGLIMSALLPYLNQNLTMQNMDLITKSLLELIAEHRNRQNGKEHVT